jgi:hypothetical protein
MAAESVNKLRRWWAAAAVHSDPLTRIDALVSIRNVLPAALQVIEVACDTPENECELNNALYRLLMAVEAEERRVASEREGKDHG